MKCPRSSKKAAEHIRSEALLEAKELGRAGSLEPVSLELHAGEVVGLAGLLGSGRTEIAQLLFGIDKPDTGSLKMEGQQVKNYSPIGSISRGVALCPEDRKDAGIVGDLTVQGKYHPGHAGQPGLVQVLEHPGTIRDRR